MCVCPINWNRWLCPRGLATFGYFWLLLATFGLFWLFFYTLGYFLLFLATFGYYWLLLANFGYLGLLLATFDYFWLLLANFGYCWILLGICGYFRVLLGNFGYIRVILSNCGYFLYLYVLLLLFGTTRPIFTWLSPSLLKKNNKWHRCYYLHQLRDSVSPVCGIFTELALRPIQSDSRYVRLFVPSQWNLFQGLLLAHRSHDHLRFIFLKDSPEKLVKCLGP